MTKDILKNPMIKKALDDFIPMKRNFQMRVRDNRPFKFVTNEISLAYDPFYCLKAQIGDILIQQIRKELGVK